MILEAGEPVYGVESFSVFLVVVFELSQWVKPWRLRGKC